VISVVIYGRNDSYGYNLHKRAAISLNCIAEVLDDPEDELLFVDYNSPDDGPTFPEAIADTLTAEAKSRLRILRARAAVHERFRKRTRLDAIEPVARNIAVRRSNPANRWILSTNSDIILVPRRKSSLSEVAAGLSHGFYHAPRFELPESLWESFDRREPQRTIEEVRGLGITARLNEVVHSDLILFDGPGDFQLVERADLFAIDGFDEEMILGWHVDSNLAARLMLKHRQVLPLLDEVFCYHCDHTRRATPAHSGARIENDWGRFVSGISRPDLPEQRDRWGCVDAEIEEIRLSSNAAHSYRTVVESAVSPLDGAFTQSSLTGDSFDSYDYAPAHVLPFLADLLHNYSRNATLGWCGVRADMFAIFSRAWRQMGFRQPIAVDAASAARGIAATAEAVRIASRADWPENCDLLVFEFGRTGPPVEPGGAIGPEDAAALESVQAAFLDVAAAERARLAEELPPRRLIGINCIHNRMEEVFAAHVGVTRTPFSSHLRHGYLLRPPNTALADAEHLALLIGHMLGRAGPISNRELALARYLFTPLLEAGEIAPRARPQIAANAELGRAFLEVAGRSRRGRPLRAATARAIAMLEAMRPTPSTELGVVVVDAKIPAEQRPLSRCAAYEDWDDPDWARFLEEPARDRDGLERHGVEWERTHCLYGLDRLWKLTPSARVLAVITLPEPLIAMLAGCVGRIDLLDLGEPGTSETQEQAWRRLSTVSSPPGYGRCRYEIVERAVGLAGLPGETYDAVLFPHGSLFVHGSLGAIDLIEAAARLLKPDGVLVFKAEIAAGDDPHPSFFDASMVAEDGLAGQLSSATELVAEGGFDRRLSRATLDKLCPEAGPAPDTVYLVFRHAGRIVFPSLWFLRKTGAPPPGGWQQVRRWLHRRDMGEQIGKLQIGEAGERRDGAIISLPGCEGNMFYGPYLRVPAGCYRARLAIEGPEEAESDWGLTVDAFDGSEILADAAVDAASLSSGVFEMTFEVRCAGGSTLLPRPELEIRAFSSGAAELRFTSVDLRFDEDDVVAPAEEAASLEALAAEIGAAVRALAADIAPASASESDEPEAEAEAEPESEAGPEAETENEAETVVAQPPSRPLSRLAAVADWDDPAWSRFAGNEASIDRGTWERAHLLYGLERAEMLRPSARIAVAAMHPDATIAELSERAGCVDVLDPRGKAQRSAAEGRLYWAEGRLYARDRLHILDRAGFTELAGRDYDAIIFPHGALFSAGVAGAAGMLAAAEAALSASGLIAFAAEIAAGVEAHPDFLDEGLIGEAGLVARLAETTGFAVEGGFDASAPRPSPLARQHDERLLHPSLWFLRKRRATPEAGWQALAAWLGGRLLGDQLHRLRVGKAGYRRGQGTIETVRGSKGHVFYGPYLVLPAGAYKATIGFELRSPRGATFAFEIVAGDHKFAQRRIAIEDAGSRQQLSLLFDIPPAPHPARPAEIEIRAWSGGAEAVFFECRLDCLGNR
jgi:hypothetical protein